MPGQPVQHAVHVPATGAVVSGRATWHVHVKGACTHSLPCHCFYNLACCISFGNNSETISWSIRSHTGMHSRSKFSRTRLSAAALGGGGVLRHPRVGSLAQLDGLTQHSTNSPNSPQSEVIQLDPLGVFETDGHLRLGLFTWTASHIHVTAIANICQQDISRQTDFLPRHLREKQKGLHIFCARVFSRYLSFIWFNKEIQRIDSTNST